MKVKANPNMKKKMKCSGTSSGSVTEHSARQRKLRPCCGLRYDKCTCKPPSGLLQRPLNQLAVHYKSTPLSTVDDTTDVNKFRELMHERCRSLPLWVVLLYAYVHVVFNQESLLKAMLREKVFLFKSPWVDWAALVQVINKAKRNKQLIRSSNYYSSTLIEIVPQTGQIPKKKPVDATERDVLACQLAAHDSLPRAISDLYDATPSRDLWKALLTQWFRQAHTRCKRNVQPQLHEVHFRPIACDQEDRPQHHQLVAVRLSVLYLLV